MCLALNIYFEARDQDIEGQLMIAEVTLNRVAEPGFPKTICDVVWQPGAFSWTDDGKSDKPRDLKAFAQSVLVASDALYTPEIMLGTKALYYHKKSVHPYWANNLTLLAVWVVSRGSR
jgi:spore germination cell wall hydrolase CwlJ-like protein